MATAARTDGDQTAITTAPSHDAPEPDAPATVLSTAPAWGAHRPTEPSPMTGCE